MTVYTSTRLTTDHGSRFLAKPNLIVLHHGATTSLDALIALMMPGGRKVSAHAAIGGKEIVNVVPESRRSFSLDASIFERRVLSAECVNSTLAPNYELSEETHESIAQWVADVSKRHRIWPTRAGGDPKKWTVIGHREVYTIYSAGYATVCPGGMKLDWIVARAQQILLPPKEEDFTMRNYVNTGTYVNGKAVKGTVAMTVFGDGTYQEYLRDPANPLEPAKVFTEALQEGHQEMTDAMYNAFKANLRPRANTTPPVGPAPVVEFPSYEGIITLNPKE